MCRSVAEGGRRCPHCDSRQGRQSHNDRRRHNRAVRSAVVSWAGDQGVSDTARAVLAAAPPSVAKAWARGRGAPSDVVDLATRRSVDPLPTVNADWATPELVDQIAAASATQGAHPQERRMLDVGIDDARQVPDPGVNDTWVVDLEDGTTAFAKGFAGVNQSVADDFGQMSAQQPLHEVGAWRLSSSLGPPWGELVPTCVLRPVTGELGSLAAQAPGSPYDDEDLITDRVRSSAAFFDSLIGNQDRHPGNRFIWGSRLTLIDHGFTFAEPGDYENWSTFVSWRYTDGDRALDAEETEAVRRLLGSTNTFGLAGMLEPTRLTALRNRAEAMLSTGQLMPEGEY